MRIVSDGRSTVSTILIAGMVVLVATAASLGTYAWRQGEVTNLNGKIKQLNTEVADLHNQISALSGSLSKACRPAQQMNLNCASYTFTSPKGVSILLYAPAKNGTVSSPMAVAGEVPGNWSSEAQFPVQLKDSKGTIVAQASAHVLGNWQTDQLVPFSAQLIYTAPETGSGTLVLQKDNPSGLASNADAISIPITF